MRVSLSQPLMDALPCRGRHCRVTTVVFGLLGLALSGCSWTDARGTHYLVVGIGFGIITSTNHPGIDVRDTRVLGAELGPDAFGVGCLSRHRVAIDPLLASNAIVSIKANPLKLTVESRDVYCTKTHNNLSEGTATP